MCKNSPISICLYVTVGLLCSGFFETTSGLNQKGNKAFKQKHYSTALEAYQKAQVRSPEQPEIRYNLGTTLYQVDKYREAASELESGLAKAKTNDLKANAWYNFGNANYRLGQFDQSIEAYRNALDLNPDDQDAKFNLELLQKKKAAFEMKQSKRDKERKEKPPQSRSQQKKDQNQGGGQNKKDEESQGESKENENDQQTQGKTEQKEEEQRNEADQVPAKKEDKPDEEKPQPLGQEEKKEEASKGDELKSPGREAPQVPEESPKDGKEIKDIPSRPLYQGQMSRQDALRILDALKDSEQELQVLRRPQTNRQAREHEPLKDW
jgi:tetratricopeptide (TPR) repeat protein